MEKENIIADKSKAFAIRIIKLYQYLTVEKKEYILSKQILRSGTSIGANIREGMYGQSRADFHTKLTIALKETAETEYWLRLLTLSQYLTAAESQSLLTDCLVLKRILIAILKTSKSTSEPPAT